MFADVSFPISSFQIFSYKIPSELSDKILIGSTVNAPLGKRNVNGIVVNCYSEKIFKRKRAYNVLTATDKTFLAWSCPIT